MTKYLTSESSHSSRKKSNRTVELTEDEGKHLLEFFATCCRIMKESYLSKVSSGKGAKDLNDDPYIKCRESFIQQDLGSWKQILAKYSHNLETLAVHLFRFRVVMMLTEWGHALVFDSDSDQFINFLHECLQGVLFTTVTPPLTPISVSSAPSSHIGATGLRNLGNTCFMNSIIQWINGTSACQTLFILDTKGLW
ncbi:hypothetical protein CONCODRAFT_3888 [Conidiobolus coronatus NRRL 28638]|uniref:USP domain-containing protein n=1 Tax=Conidiobolus coronatus (strain ATCC 28846 / CBS 209.66 / NRRL 28638) TaxID=796925 RepID=A0A137PE01_CONC2|nr:hypothetical protein CONCODRAFT_3888 [Conidiobolus coronatus NRRL 28638]|eukprot:KXN73217.1 hypothetical protein CONCODRAFT_3888 [Conidiobolus coronatus NRRL 28638]